MARSTAPIATRYILPWAPNFPLELLPDGTGLIVADATQAEILREAPSHPLAPARRRALLHRFAMLGAERLAAFEDPAGFASRRAALRVE